MQQSKYPESPRNESEKNQKSLVKVSILLLLRFKETLQISVDRCSKYLRQFLDYWRRRLSLLTKILRKLVLPLFLRTIVSNSLFRLEPAVPGCVIIAPTNSVRLIIISQTMSVRIKRVAAWGTPLQENNIRAVLFKGHSVRYIR